MAQEQNNVTRFAGPSMIQDAHHMSGIPQVQDDNSARQSEQGQSESRKKGSKDRRENDFEYQNPRQQY